MIPVGDITMPKVIMRTLTAFCFVAAIITSILFHYFRLYQKMVSDPFMGKVVISIVESKNMER